MIFDDKYTPIQIILFGFIFIPIYGVMIHYSLKKKRKVKNHGVYVILTIIMTIFAILMGLFLMVK